MKRIGSVVLTCTAVACIGASAALADNPTPTPDQVASKQCTNELHAVGIKQFKINHGDSPPKYQHAMRNCKGKHENSAENTVSNAAQACKAEQADPNFSATHGNLTFDQFYGTNGKVGTNGADKNSFGKCVSGKVHQALDQNEANLQNAAALCRAERAAANFPASHGGKTFSQFYGTEKSKLKNAFGKCVSQKAKAQNTSV
jgi:hypothetical protein